MVALGMLIAFVTVSGGIGMLGFAVAGMVADARRLRATLTLGAPPHVPEARVVVRNH